MKWMDWIELTLNTIHQADVMLGNAKTENFLIDKQDKAWIIDFGGSYRPGWDGMGTRIRRNPWKGICNTIIRAWVCLERTYIQKPYRYELDIGWYTIVWVSGRRLFPST